MIAVDLYTKTVKIGEAFRQYQKDYTFKKPVKIIIKTSKYHKKD